MATRVPLDQRFWSYVDKRGPNECWPWRGYTHPTWGYGRFSINDQSHEAHRVSWQLANGRKPVGLVCHSCDNPSCVNPAHLWEGSPADNTRDMIRKGRAGWMRRTHCKRGHALTPENIGPNGKGRTCRLCRKARRQA